MRKVVTTLSLVIIVLLLIIAGCARKEGGAKILKLAHGLDINHPVHKAMIYMAEKVAEKSGGRLAVRVYPSEQLGNERECIELLQLGSLAMVKTSTGPMEGFVPKIKIYGIPYLFRDSGHYWRVLNSPIGKMLLAEGAKKGLKGLCYYDAGARSFYAKKPINTPADLRGLKFRVMNSPMAMQMVKTMGGSPTPIPWGELYTSLDQGVVDGAENNPPSFETSRHYEICKFYILDEHVRLPDMLLISTKVWNELGPEFQQILQEAVDESVEHQRKLWVEAEKAALEKVQAAGVKVIRPDKQPFIKSVQPMWKEYENTELGELIKQIQEVK